MSRLLAPAKAKLETARRLDDSALDRTPSESRTRSLLAPRVQPADQEVDSSRSLAAGLAAITLVLHTLQGPPTKERLAITQLALHVAQVKRRYMHPSPARCTDATRRTDATHSDT